VPASSPRRVAVPIARKERRRLDSSETWRSTCFRDIICSYFWRGKLCVSGEEGDGREYVSTVFQEMGLMSSSELVEVVGRNSRGSKLMRFKNGGSPSGTSLGWPSSSTRRNSSGVLVARAYSP